MTEWTWRLRRELRACIWGGNRWGRERWCAGARVGTRQRILWLGFRATVWRKRARRRERGLHTFFSGRYSIRLRSGGWGSRRASRVWRRFAGAWRFRGWRLGGGGKGLWDAIAKKSNPPSAPRTRQSAAGKKKRGTPFGMTGQTNMRQGA